MELIRQSMRSGIACLGGTLRTLAVAISRTLVDFFLRFVTAQLENLATPKPTRKKSFSTRRISEPLRIFDLKKMEDIFCRAGGNILVQLRAAHPDNTTSDEPFDVSIDGERKRINAGEIVRLHPESLRN